MPGSDDADTLPLVPGRECGPCSVCCTAFTVDDPELQKPQGIRCGNVQPDGGCGIYHTRPGICRNFFCGWRRLKWVRDSLRPDLSNVLLRLQYGPADDGKGMRMGISIGLLNEAALKADGLAETAAAAVAAGLPVYLHIPGPPGFTAAEARINDLLAGPVKAKDKKKVLEVLRRVRTRALGGTFKPLVMQYSGHPAPPAAAQG